MLELKPIRRVPCPKAAWRASCYRLAKHKKFDAYILCVILLNTLLMALDGYGIPSFEVAEDPS